MFLRIGVIGARHRPALDPSVLLAALGAAVIGRMERMPTTVLAAVGLGIVAEAAVFTTRRTTSAPRSPAVIIAGRAARCSARRRVDRLASAASSTWQATREIRPIPAELRRVPAVRTPVALAAGALARRRRVVPFVFSPECT